MPNTPEEAYADAVAMAQARLEQAKAELAEHAKWAAKRKVLVTAIKRASSDLNSKKFDFYWVPGHKLAHGETIELDLSEREIHNMKMDPFVKVDESPEALAAFHAPKTKAAPVAQEEAPTAPVEPPAPPPPGVPPAAAEGLQELQFTKKGKGKA